MSVIKHLFRDFSRVNCDIFFENVLETLDNYSVNLEAGAEDQFDRFLLFLQKVLNKFFPTRSKQISIKRLEMPWLNDRVIRLINKKHKMFIALKRKLVSCHCFKVYAKDLSELISRLKCKYIKNKFTTCKGDSKKTWQMINLIYNRKNR